jgi:multiple sugar transport system ATP-binding protein
VASITLTSLTKIYPNGQVGVEELDLQIRHGELLVLVGPSGCGKSTTLRLIAGLETPTRGRIAIGERDVSAVPPRDRDVAMVFQSYALYPHKSVRENLAFGLRMRRAEKELIARQVENVAQVLQLEDVLERRPAQLSGGQRQRVALGRAIAREPQVFLLDEPLSNLDAKLRVQTRTELARLHRRLGATMVYVTHDQEEAMTLGERVAVLHNGRLMQVAAPMDIYREPANAFVAGFIGSPAMNFLRGSLQREDGKPQWKGLGTAVWLEQAPIAEAPEVLLGIRPHDIRVVGAGEGDVTARVDVIQPLGSELQIHLVLDADDRKTRITAVVAPDTKLAVDDCVGLQFLRSGLRLFDAETGERLAPPG